MADGVDVAGDSRPILNCLSAANYEFVARYFAFHTQIPGKILTRAEAEAISAAGLRIVTVWENGSPEDPSYFSHDKGVSDGGGAYQAALALGQPAGTPIYFAVDYDASQADINAPIAAYFQGVNDAFAATGAGSPAYSIGVYGSGLVCSSIMAASFATKSWLAAPPAWQGSAGYTGWSIKQGIERTLCGQRLDPDVSQGSYGGFQVAATTMAFAASTPTTAPAPFDAAPDTAQQAQAVITQTLDRIEQIAQRSATTTGPRLFFPNGIELIDFQIGLAADKGITVHLTVSGPKGGTAHGAAE